MKKLWLLVAALLFMAGATLAGTGPDESVCPAHRASEKGYDPLDGFHSVMAPAWHTAWPKQDYEALFAVAPRFEEKIKPIMELEPDLRDERLESFNSYRTEFADVVAAYAEAARNGDKEKVYELMPEVHECFEQTASSLLPIHYPLIESLAMTARLITETHLPDNNMKGILGSTETLNTRIEGLNEESIPEELDDSKEALLKEFAELKKLASQMQECCDNEDMENYQKHASAFEARIKSVVRKYL